MAEVVTDVKAVAVAVAKMVTNVKAVERVGGYKCNFFSICRKMFVSLQPETNTFVIMSRVNRGFNLTAMNGSVGAVTYVTRKGITVAKQKVPAKLNYTKTLRSMTPRMRWMAIVRMWQALNTVGWHPSFRNKEGLQTDFNMFMKANSPVDVYLPKSVVSANGGVVAPVQVTQGGLPSIGGNIVSQNFQSNIVLGGITIGASTTLATLSRAILENNPEWNSGDQLTVVRLDQSVDAETNIPRITGLIAEIVLDPEDDGTLLSDLLDLNILTSDDGKLGIMSVNGGACFVHSTGEGDNFDVSSETLAVANPILTQYTSNTALMAAINSYGGLSGVQFLIP